MAASIDAPKPTRYAEAHWGLEPCWEGVDLEQCMLDSTKASFHNVITRYILNNNSLIYLEWGLS